MQSQIGLDRREDGMGTVNVDVDVEMNEVAIEDEEGVR